MPDLITTNVMSIKDRIAGYEWSDVSAQLDSQGWTVLRGVLSADECMVAAAWFDEDERFRKHIVMQNHGFGRGEYKYFNYPLPDVVQELRTSLYPHLALTANRWGEWLKTESRFSDTLDFYLTQCHEAGQDRPTPLLLQYGAGDYNALHQDLYGDLVFPLQATFLLSKPGEDFEGGEFVLTEQRPRLQSTVEVVPLAQGDCVVFAVNHRPVTGAHSTYRVRMRHGVSRIRSGHRHTLGVLFHDAR